MKPMHKALATALVVLAIVGGGLTVAEAQVQQPFEWIRAKRLTVATQADIGTTLTADTVIATTATFANLTAPTVTMTSATTWTVASLTATALQATNGTVTALGVTTGTIANANVTAATITDATITEATVTTATVTSATLSDLTVNGNAAITGTLDVDADTTLAGLEVEGNGDVTGNWEVVDHLLTQAELYLIPPAAVTLEDGGIITPTASVMEITSAAEVTATLATAGDGQVLILVNVGSETINIADAGTTKLANAVALGADDTITLIGAGVTWYEISRSNN